MFSIWEKTGFMEEPHLAVVGSGIVGLFAALHYQRSYPHHRVVVLERGPHPSGASVKNAGFACFGSPSEILADMDDEGADIALARVEERWQGLRELRAELGDEAIGFGPVGGHELYAEGDPLYTKVASRFDELNAALRPIFGRPVYEWLNPAKGDMGLRAAHIAYNDLEGPLDSGALMRTLLAKVASAGVEVRFNSDVQRVDEAPTATELALADGSRLKAAQVLVATNGYTRQLFPEVDVVPARGQVLLTSPVPGLQLRGTFHMNEGYFYFRDLHERILLGGGRHMDKAGETTTEDAVTPAIQDALEALLRDTILPGRDFTIEQRWSGVMGFRSKGKTPLVARRSDHVVLAAGLSGMGVAIGIRVAKRAVELL